MSYLWVPQGFTLNEPVEYGRAEEGEGAMAMGFSGTWTCPKCGETHRVDIATAEEHGRVSTDQLEEAFGTAVENGWKKHQLQHEIVGTRLLPTQVGQNTSVRRDVAGAIREWKATKKRLAESSNGKIHWMV